MKICPSVASGDVMNLQAQCLWLQEKYRHIHIDIEDGNYIDNITFGMKTVRGIFAATSCEKSVHLMVMNPLDYVEPLAVLKPEIVFVHLDTSRYPSKVVDAFAQAGIRTGIALNPAEPLDRYGYLMDRVTDVLLMMCEPDGYGQRYQKGIEEKVIKALEGDWNVWLDGAMSMEQAVGFGEKGVSAVVLGRAVFQK